MGNDNPVLIGKRRPGNGSGGNFGEFFFLTDGINAKVDNIYRVLPPVHSLAQHGKYAQYHAVHKGFRGSPTEKQPKGVYFPFACIQEKNGKTKMITRHCPICDRVAELEAQLEVAEKSGATKDQISDFRTAQIMPLQSEKKYYINVINQEGKIGVLAISYKMFQDLEARMGEYDKKGIDLTGAEAPFLNFTVTKRFKGDRDAIHKVDAYLQPSQDGSFRYVTHTLTPEIVDRLRTEARDLTKLFKEIDVESMAQLAVSDPATRQGIVDRILSASENTKDAVQGGGNDAPALTANLPGVNAQAVSNVEVVNGNLNVHTPTDLIGAMATAAKANPNTLPPVSTPLNQMPQAAPAPAQSAPASSSPLTDAQFMAMFAPKS